MRASPLNVWAAVRVGGCALLPGPAPLCSQQRGAPNKGREQTPGLPQVRPAAPARECLLAEALAEARAQALALAQMQAPALAQVQALAQPQALAPALPQAQALVQVLAPAAAQVRALAQVWAQEKAGASQ